MSRELFTRKYLSPPSKGIFKKQAFIYKSAAGKEDLSSLTNTNMPTEERKFYLTKEGLARLKRELHDLKELKLAKTKGESPKILHSEDLNPEYLAFQEDMSFLEIRLVELENILKNAELIKSPSREKQNIVNLGATILIEVDGQKDEFTLVGSLEANPSLGKISNESPVGKALLGHRAGDAVVVSSPIQTTYKIKKIKYKTA